MLDAQKNNKRRIFKEDKEVYARYTEEEKMLIKMTL